MANYFLGGALFLVGIMLGTGLNRLVSQPSGTGQATAWQQPGRDYTAHNGGGSGIPGRRSGDTLTEQDRGFRAGSPGT